MNNDRTDLYNYFFFKSRHRCVEVVKSDPGEVCNEPPFSWSVAFRNHAQPVALHQPCHAFGERAKDTIESVFVSDEGRHHVGVGDC